MKFILNGLKKNKQEFEIKKAFFKFGFITDFKYDGENGTANLNINKLKKNEFEEYCRINNIDFKEQKAEIQQERQNSQIGSRTNHSSTISNPSFHYYKDMAYGKGIEDFTYINNFKDFFEIPNAQTFKLTTIYPGLLVGSGYNHPKLHENKDDFQLGFLFDHTTGLPIISGSSIKGLLRSVCEKTDFMQDVYDKTVSLDIFEDGKTIFYDAYIVGTKNKDKKIFGSDYVTPHKNSNANLKIPDEFCEPVPIKFLKILPDVIFKFQFKAPKEQVDLFKEIILDFGLGAKTNVGYGKFIE